VFREAWSIAKKKRDYGDEKHLAAKVVASASGSDRGEAGQEL